MIRARRGGAIPTRPRRPGARRRRAAPLGALACLLVAVVALLAACADQVPGSGRVVGISTTDASAPTPGEADPTQTVSPTTSAYSGVCPDIIDNEAKLAYRCIDDSLRIDPLTASSVGLTMALVTSTEIGWVAMQGSGHATSISGATAQLVARNAVSDMVSGDYGPSPTSAVQSEGDLRVGRSAYRIDTVVTIDPQYTQQQGLKVKQELLSVTVVEVAQGRFSLMMVTIPDTEKPWWANIDDVVASLRVV